MIQKCLSLLVKTTKNTDMKSLPAQHLPKEALMKYECL